MLNSIITNYSSSIVNPTINLSSGVVSNLPLLYLDEKGTEVTGIVEKNIRYEKDDWNSFETSWDFKKHLLI